MQAKSHHLVLGRLRDVITDEILDDTHDERLRQGLARLLLQKGFDKNEITPRKIIKLENQGRHGEAKVDFVLSLEGVISMILRYGPGSIVTRHRPALAAARLVAKHEAPVAVATNGRDADVLDVATGEVVGHGLEAIPDRAVLSALLAQRRPRPVDAKRREVESRILFTYDLVGTCNCDDMNTPGCR